jgi:putative ABC transport system ATP-binding protein
MIDSSAILQAVSLQKRYLDGDVSAVNGVSLSIHAGESVAITGPSGSGKSTLLNLLGALDRPDSGELFFRGQPVFARSDLDRFRALEVGFVFQSFHLLSSLTSRENIQVPMLEDPFTTRRDRLRRADELLELVGMSHRSRSLPAKLSVGERQRVALARALANSPSLLLADEPTGNLDSDNTIRVLELLESLRKDHGLTMVIVTHSEDVASRSGRRIVIRDGRATEQPVTTNY